MFMSGASDGGRPDQAGGAGPGPESRLLRRARRNDSLRHPEQ